MTEQEEVVLVLEEVNEQEDCGICGCNLNDKFSHTLKCNHTFHYECLMKSFQNVAGANKYKDCNHLQRIKRTSIAMSHINLGSQGTALHHSSG